MHCPVGLSGVGPERTGETAVAVAAAILQTREMLRAQPRTPAWPVARK
jgi:xanthine/CO dehydrogenase XdhC/CoxF family maturation factor